MVIQSRFRRGQRLPDADAGFVRLRSRLACLVPRIGQERRARQAVRRDPLFDNVDRVEDDYHRFRNLTVG